MIFIYLKMKPNGFHNEKLFYIDPMKFKNTLEAFLVLLLTGESLNKCNLMETKNN